jgi:hypothetical protein
VVTATPLVDHGEEVTTQEELMTVYCLNFETSCAKALKHDWCYPTPSGVIPTKKQRAIRINVIVKKLRLLLTAKLLTIGVESTGIMFLVHVIIHCFIMYVYHSLFNATPTVHPVYM